MLLKEPIQNVFVQLSESLNLLQDAEYIKPSKLLFNATIGQHARHIIELFLCLEKGYSEGVVNYEKRKRDHRIETDRKLAIQLLKDVFHRIERPNIDIFLETEDYEDRITTVSIPTNYYREIAYNLEHTIHHMALIRVGINEVSSIELPEEFGVAFSTIKYRKECAQ
jgi:hypothetical protein